MIPGGYSLLQASIWLQPSKQFFIHCIVPSSHLCLLNTEMRMWCSILSKAILNFKALIMSPDSPLLSMFFPPLVTYDPPDASMAGCLKVQPRPQYLQTLLSFILWSRWHLPDVTVLKRDNELTLFFIVNDGNWQTTWIKLSLSKRK